MNLPERDVMEADVVIVGAGPAGLATAIKLREMSLAQGLDWQIMLLEKGAEVGAHILSGAVIDPSGLDALIPDWRDDASCPLKQQVNADHFYLMGPSGAIRIPHFLMPPMLSNKGAYIGSLGLVCKWLAARAEALGVQIFPGFAAAEVLKNDAGHIIGVATGDMGISKGWEAKGGFARGVEIHAKYTIFAEGARGHLTKQLIQDYDLAAQASPQKYGIGLKELWVVDAKKHKPGLVQHSMGWPLDNQTGGGSFLYHYGENRVAIGFVVHLDYANPTLSPFEEFQKYKNHPMISELLEGAQRIAYGARAISEGGWQSVPKLVMPGAALVGCGAGFVNVPRIKGSHNAVHSGILAAEHLGAALLAGRAHDELMDYENAWRNSPIGRDLYPVRNVKALWSRFGTLAGLALGGFDMWCQSIFKFSVFGTLKHLKADYASLKHKDDAKAIVYEKPNGVTTFDRLTSLSLTGVWHEEDQPVHLHLKDPKVPIAQNLPLYGEPARLYCPAAVYEVVEDAGEPKFIINAQNCIHCKTCDIKDPSQNINWVVPEGGQGPNYTEM